MKKVNRILLIDDNEADNFFHQMVIEETNLAEHLNSETNSRKTLNSLLYHSPKYGKRSSPTRKVDVFEQKNYHRFTFPADSITFAMQIGKKEAVERKLSVVWQ